MKLFFILAPLALAASVAASALPKRGDGGCLSQSEAESIVSQYASILTHTDVATANATAQALLDENYTEISDSILSLEGQPVSHVILARSIAAGHRLTLVTARHRNLRRKTVVHRRGPQFAWCDGNQHPRDRRRRLQQNLVVLVVHWHW